MGLEVRSLGLDDLFLSLGMLGLFVIWVDRAASAQLVCGGWWLALISLSVCFSLSYFHPYPFS